MLERYPTVNYLGKECTKQDEAYNNMHFADDEVFSELRYINFKKVLPHS